MVRLYSRILHIHTPGGPPLEVGPPDIVTREWEHIMLGGCKLFVDQCKLDHCVWVFLIPYHLNFPDTKESEIRMTSEGYDKKIKGGIPVFERLPSDVQEKILITPQCRNIARSCSQTRGMANQCNFELFNTHFGFRSNIESATTEPTLCSSVSNNNDRAHCHRFYNSCKRTIVPSNAYNNFAAWWKHWSHLPSHSDYLMHLGVLDRTIGKVSLTQVLSPQQRVTLYNCIYDMEKLRSRYDMNSDRIADHIYEYFTQLWDEWFTASNNNQEYAFASCVKYVIRIFTRARYRSAERRAVQEGRGAPLFRHEPTEILNLVQRLNDTVQLYKNTRKRKHGDDYRAVTNKKSRSFS